MSDFTLKYESCDIVLNYSVAESDFEDGSDEVRLLHEELIAGWKFKSPALTIAQANAHKDFFDGKFGGATTFTWTWPMNGVEYNVRYVIGSFKITHSDGYYRVEWEFKRIA